LIPAALLTLAPKCVLCVLAYAGLAAALGLGGPEICGASGETNGHQAMWLFAPSVAMGIAAVRMFGRNQRKGSSRNSPSKAGAFDLAPPENTHAEMLSELPTTTPRHCRARQVVFISLLKKRQAK
jgi:hypothetical protein